MTSDRPAPEATERLIERARAGDRQAMAALLVQVRGRLDELANRLLGSKLRARVRISDIVQSTCCEVIEGIQGFQGSSGRAFNAWVAQILRNNLRKKGRHFNAEKRREPDEAGRFVEPVQLEDPAAGPEAVQADELRLVSRALDRLPEKQRRVLVWRLLENRDYDEIARLEDTSPANARSLVFRARAALSLEVRRLRREAP